MALLRKFGLITAVALACAPAAARRALADEAFLCGPNKVVYVAVEDLEARKRTDPCIAAYFGLTVDKDAVAKAKAAPGSTSGRPAKAVPLKTLVPPEVAERLSVPVERSASLLPPAASPGTDFRNVRVLNATSRDEQWFKHVR